MIRVTKQFSQPTLASYPGVQKGGGNAWYTLFAHALNLLQGNCIMDASDVDVWAGFC